MVGFIPKGWASCGDPWEHPINIYWARLGTPFPTADVWSSFTSGVKHFSITHLSPLLPRSVLNVQRNFILSFRTPSPNAWSLLGRSLFYLKTWSEWLWLGGETHIQMDPRVVSGLDCKPESPSSFKTVLVPGIPSFEILDSYTTGLRPGRKDLKFF